jgi:hypothetical protein
MRKYLNQIFSFQADNGDIICAKAIDVEFETGFGPIFLMETAQGGWFWVTLKELKEYQIAENVK